MQRVERRMTTEGVEVAGETLRVRAADDRAQVRQLITPVRMCRDKPVELLAGQIPGVDIFARRRVVHLDERGACVLQGGADRTLEQAVERGQLALGSQSGTDRGCG